MQSIVISFKVKFRSVFFDLDLSRLCFGFHMRYQIKSVDNNFICAFPPVKLMKRFTNFLIQS